MRSRYKFDESDTSEESDDTTAIIRRRARITSSSRRRAAGRRMYESAISKSGHSSELDEFDFDRVFGSSRRSRSRDRDRRQMDSKDDIPAGEAQRLVNDIVSQWIDVHEDEDEKSSDSEEESMNTPDERSTCKDEKDEDSAGLGDGVRKAEDAGR
jgi:hypothetical protein